jgi:hypothetical protein
MKHTVDESIVEVELDILTQQLANQIEVADDMQTHVVIDPLLARNILFLLKEIDIVLKDKNKELANLQKDIT